MADLSLSIDPTSIARLFAKLDRATATATLRVPMTAALATLHRDLATYPPQSRKRQPAHSRKQQIKQIMLAKEGKIPYQRTGDLGRSWTSEVSATEGGLEGRLGNAVASRETGKHYGPLVEGGPGEQAEYFVGSSWPTVNTVLQRHEAAIVESFANAIERALGG